jgi:hypothetical protein
MQPSAVVHCYGMTVHISDTLHAFTGGHQEAMLLNGCGQGGVWPCQTLAGQEPVCAAQGGVPGNHGLFARMPLGCTLAHPHCTLTGGNAISELTSPWGPRGCLRAGPASPRPLSTSGGPPARLTRATAGSQPWRLSTQSGLHPTITIVNRFVGSPVAEPPGRNDASGPYGQEAPFHGPQRPMGHEQNENRTVTHRM